MEDGKIKRFHKECNELAFTFDVVNLIKSFQWFRIHEKRVENFIMRSHIRATNEKLMQHRFHCHRYFLLWRRQQHKHRLLIVLKELTNRFPIAPQQKKRRNVESSLEFLHIHNHFGRSDFHRRILWKQIRLQNRFHFEDQKLIERGIGFQESQIDKEMISRRELLRRFFDDQSTFRALFCRLPNTFLQDVRFGFRWNERRNVLEAHSVFNAESFFVIGCDVEEISIDEGGDHSTRPDIHAFRILR